MASRWPFLKEPAWVLVLKDRRGKTTLNKALHGRKPIFLIANIFYFVSFCKIVLFLIKKKEIKEKRAKMLLTSSVRCLWVSFYLSLLTLGSMSSLTLGGGYFPYFIVFFLICSLCDFVMVWYFLLNKLHIPLLKHPKFELLKILGEVLIFSSSVPCQWC